MASALEYFTIAGMISVAVISAFVAVGSNLPEPSKKLEKLEVTRSAKYPLDGGCAKPTPSMSPSQLSGNVLRADPFWVDLVESGVTNTYAIVQIFPDGKEGDCKRGEILVRLNHEMNYPANQRRKPN